MFGSKMVFLNMSSSDIANRNGLIPFLTRRKYSDVVFMYELINGKINCSEFSIFHHK